MVDKAQSDFKGKTALITGGARNIGLAIAKDLASRGVSVAIADICHDLETIPYNLSTEADLDKCLAELAAFEVNSLGLTCDVRIENQVQQTIERVIGEFGKLDILVNNAGVISLFCLNEITEKAWNEVMDVCLKGTFFCCKYTVPYMVENKYGKVVNISSVAGLRGLGLSIHYAAAKHGIIGLTKALAMEVADHNINVNAICPGTVESPMLEGLACQINLAKDTYEHFSQGHLFKDRRITPQDIANAVRWLASDESRFLTGAVINVDAGWTARG
jgi:NAD(P)-dependent dehydrogenase (short-subunit alcohol dehydrogenase family)